MAIKDRTALIAEINTIKNETQKGANTANRIGSALTDIIDSISNSGFATGMDLDNDNFTIQNAGVYFVASSPSNGILFPDASLFGGCEITIVNTADSPANIQQGTSGRPKSLDGNDVTSIMAYSCWKFTAIDGNWYLTNQYSV
jgi:hypothetical protein